MNLIVEKIVSNDEVVYVVRTANGWPVSLEHSLEDVAKCLDRTFQSVTKTDK